MPQVSWTKRLFARAFSSNASTQRGAADDFVPAPEVLKLTEEMALAEASRQMSFGELSIEIELRDDSDDVLLSVLKGKPLNANPVEASSSEELPLRQQIETLANAIWRENGCPEGQALDHWLMAEQRAARNA